MNLILLAAIVVVMIILCSIFDRNKINPRDKFSGKQMKKNKGGDRK